MIWHGMVKFWRKGNAYPCQIVAEKKKINAKENATCACNTNGVLVEF